LRSQLSKNALNGINIAILQLGRKIEPFLDILVLQLLKKAIDTNAFISEAGIQALSNLCTT
jgi:hypothetical protein